MLPRGLHRRMRADCVGIDEWSAWMNAGVPTQGATALGSAHSKADDWHDSPAGNAYQCGAGTHLCNFLPPSLRPPGK